MTNQVQKASNTELRQEIYINNKPAMKLNQIKQRTKSATEKAIKVN